MYGQFFISYKDEIRDNLLEMARRFNRDAEKGNEHRGLVNNAAESYSRFCGYTYALHDILGIFVEPVTAANKPYYSILKSLKIDWNHKDPSDAPHDTEIVSVDVIDAT